MARRLRKAAARRFDAWLASAYASRQARHGRVVLVVDARIAAEIKAAVWEKHVAQAAEIWEGRPADVGLSDWRKAMIEKGQVIGTWHDGRKGTGGDTGAPPR